MRKLLASLFILLLLGTYTQAQERTVTGTVKGKDDGLPLPGVSVRLKGSSIGTQTGANGAYSIKVNGTNAVLVFTYIGYRQVELPVAGNKVVNVSLSSQSNELGEVMVVAYGTVKKESFTGSASVVKKDVIENRPVTSFEKALQGAVAGVTVTSASGQPGAASTVRIRGVGSISAGNTPLYVIDGIAVTTGNLSQLNDPDDPTVPTDVLSTLNPNDIESVTVLKDASASSIYGSRAANGVILITTKRGRAGASKFSASFTQGYSNQAVKKPETMNASQYFKYYFDYYYNSQLAKGATPEAAALAANASTIKSLQTNPYNTSTPYQAGGVLSESAKLYYDTDWRDAVINTGKTKDVNVSLSGGNEKTKFFVSGGYFDQDGIVIGSDFKRYSGKINLSNEVNKWLSTGVNTTLAYTDQNTPAGSTGSANPVRFSDVMANVYSLYERDESGNPIPDPRHGGFLYNYKNPLSVDFNPVGLSKLDQYNTQTARAIVNPYAEVKFLKDFTYKANFAFDYINNREKLFYNTEHGNGSNVKGRGARYSTQDITLTITNTINYNKTFGAHNFNVLVGQEAYKTRFDLIEAQATTFPSSETTELIAGSVPVAASSYVTEKRLSSYFSRLNYSYDEKYYLSGSFRRDGSSVFGPDSKYGNFYSIGGAWRLTKEEFLKGLSWLDEFKLRASYGTSGNDRISRYASQGQYGLGYNYGGNPGISYSNLENKNLKWESNKQTDVGLEFALFKGRVSGEVAYYNRKSDGLLYDRPLSYTTGFDNITTNLASMSNSGLDVLLSGDAINSNGFTWNVSANLTTFKNKINDLAGASSYINGTKRWTVGGNLYEFYLKQYAGVDPGTGKPMWWMDEVVNGVATGKRVTTTKYNAGQYYESGSSLPKFSGGLTNKFSYKNFDFTAFVFFNYGNKVYDRLYSELMHGGAVVGRQLAIDSYKAWTPENMMTDVPRFIPKNTDLGESTSTRFLFDGSYIRVKNLALGYSLNKKWVESLKIANARVFVNAENVFTFAKHKGMDPEVELSGMVDNDIPNVRTISFGVNVGF